MFDLKFGSQTRSRLHISDQTKHSEKVHLFLESKRGREDLHLGLSVRQQGFVAYSGTSTPAC